jgi:hypothetical protein
MPIKFEGSLPTDVSSELGIIDVGSWKITSFDRTPLVGDHTSLDGWLCMTYVGIDVHISGCMGLRSLQILAKLL